VSFPTHSGSHCFRDDDSAVQTPEECQAPIPPALTSHVQVSEVVQRPLAVVSNQNGPIAATSILGIGKKRPPALASNSSGDSTVPKRLKESSLQNGSTESTPRPKSTTPSRTPAKKLKERPKPFANRLQELSKLYKET
jgi:hypothetical protein